MATLGVECLRCGKQHLLARAERGYLQHGECPRCGYVGWATTEELDERLRRLLRERPVDRRRLSAAS